MNIRRITQYLRLKEQLTDDELRLAETFSGLSETDRSLLVETLGPAKKASKRKTGSKSKRAAGLASQISGAVGIQRCTASVEGKLCGEPQGHALHEDQTYANYHPFVFYAASAGGPSSRKSAVDESEASTEGETESALGVGASGD